MVVLGSFWHRRQRDLRLRSMFSLSIFLYLITCSRVTVAGCFCLFFVFVTVTGVGVIDSAKNGFVASTASSGRRGTQENVDSSIAFDSVECVSMEDDTLFTDNWIFSSPLHVDVPDILNVYTDGKGDDKIDVGDFAAVVVAVVSVVMHNILLFKFDASGGEDFSAVAADADAGYDADAGVPRSVMTATCAGSPSATISSSV